MHSQFLGLQSPTALRVLSVLHHGQLPLCRPWESFPGVKSGGGKSRECEPGGAVCGQTLEKRLCIGKRCLGPRETTLLGTGHWVVFGDHFCCLWFLSQWLPTPSLELGLLSQTPSCVCKNLLFLNISWTGYICRMDHSRTYFLFLKETTDNSFFTLKITSNFSFANDNIEFTVKVRVCLSWTETQSN